MKFTAEQLKAKAQLALLHKKLAKWLEYRDIVDQLVEQGKIQEIHRSDEIEQQLATQLYNLLVEAGDAENVPLPEDPNAAATLARYIVDPSARIKVPSAQGGVWTPWTLGVLIVVAGVTIISIANAATKLAEEAAEREYTDCVKAGRCPPKTDTSWMQYALVAGAGYFAYKIFLSNK